MNPPDTSQIGPLRWVRPEFVAAMEKEIFANGHKARWTDWRPTQKELQDEIAHHFVKLCGALERGDGPAVREHSADVANFCMKTHEMYGATDPSSPAPPAPSEDGKRPYLRHIHPSFDSYLITEVNDAAIAHDYLGRADDPKLMISETIYLTPEEFAALKEFDA